MLNIKYSFLVPVYNVDKYLEKCLESIIIQRQFSSSCEVILVDDGSTDYSGEMCDRYAAKYPNIFVFHQDNSGLLLARATGVKNASGEYYIFVDSDDFIENNFLDVIDHYISDGHPDVLVCGYFLCGRCSKKRCIVTDFEAESISKESMLEKFAGTDKYNRVWGKVVKGNFLKEHIDEIYDCAVNIGEDKLQTAYIIKYASDFLLINECLYNYILRDDSIVHYKSEKDIRDAIYIYSKVRGIVQKICDDQKYSSSEANELLLSYDSNALNTVMEHLFKYNKRDISLSEKKVALSGILEDNKNFFVSNKKEIKLKFINKLRYRLYINKKLVMLHMVDRMLFRFKKMVYR